VAAGKDEERPLSVTHPVSPVSWAAGSWAAGSWAAGSWDAGSWAAGSWDRLIGIFVVSGRRDFSLWRGAMPHEMSRCHCDARGRF